MTPHISTLSPPHQPSDDDLPYSGCSKSVSTLNTYVWHGPWGCHSVQLIESIKTVRCSFEHLETADVWEEQATPALQVPEGEQTIASTKRQFTTLVVSKREMREDPHSPITTVALTPLALSPAFLSQANSVRQLSWELERIVLKPPNEGDSGRFPYGNVNLIFTLSVVQQSLKRLVPRRPRIPKPVSPRA
jgi:hypothetical protein